VTQFQAQGRCIIRTTSHTYDAAGRIQRKDLGNDVEKWREYADSLPPAESAGGRAISGRMSARRIRRGAEAITESEKVRK
jgi:hypothetical protein